MVNHTLGILEKALVNDTIDDVSDELTCKITEGKILKAKMESE